MRQKVLVVESDDSRREAWISIVERASDLAVAGAGPEFTAVVSRTRLPSDVHVLLINVDDPPMNSARSWARLRASTPGHLHVAALTSGEDHQVLEATLAAGIVGLQPFTIGARRLVSVLRRAARGEVDFAPDLFELARSLLIEPLDERQLAVGGLLIDTGSGTVTRWGRPIRVSPIEYELLVHLARNINRLIHPSELLKEVWGAKHGAGGTDDQIRGSVKRLRAKIEPDPHHPRYLLSHRGRGYILVNPFLPSDQE